MPNVDTNALKGRAAGMLNGFTGGQKAVIIIAVVMLVAGGVFFAQWAAKPTMVPLFSNLASEDASEITTKLQSDGVQYELTDGGGTILVPQNEVYQARINLAGEGLPSGGTAGYELLDKQGITTSEFREKVDYQRALEGELAKTISAMDGVDVATVHLVIPKEDVFAQDAKKPSASVLIQTDPGKTLSGGNVKAIVNLVGSSVEGLDAQGVTVADSSGKLLAAPGQAGSAAGMNEEQTAATQSKEGEIAAKIQAMLTPVVGQGKALVSASVDLNFDKTQQTSEVWNPNNKPATSSSEAIKQETYGNGGGADATGVLGPEGVPLAQGANGATGPYSLTDTKRDLVNDRTVTQTDVAPGAVERQSIAVVLDSNVAGVDIAEVERVVAEAAGVQVARGDTIAVSRMAFDQTQAEAAAKELEAAGKAEKQAELMNIIKSAATVVVILVVLAILFFMTKRKAANYAPTPISLAELEAARVSPLASADDLANAALEAGESNPEALERQKVDREIGDLIERQPDEVAGLLRSWLADRRS